MSPLDSSNIEQPLAFIDTASFPIVGICVSAGGFEAFSQLLHSLPAQCGLAIVLLQHLDPTHSSSLVGMLSGMQFPIVMLGRDLRIRGFTPTAAKVLNLIPTDLDRLFSDVKPELQLADLHQLIAEVLGTLVVKEREFQAQDRHWYQLIIRPYRTLDDKMEGVVIAVVDVDTLKRSEQRIIEAEAHLRAILDTAAEGIITINEHGTIQSFNRAAEQIFGCQAEEVRGKNVSSLMPTPYREQHDGFLKHYRETGENKIIGIGREVVGIRKDGRVFPMHLSVSEVHGDKRIFTGIIRDITLVKEFQERAMQNERLAAIGQLSAGLAHECRNALQRSQACLEMLSREVNELPRAMDLIARIQKAQNHLLELYEEVSAYAAPLKIQRRRCDLAKLVQDAWGKLVGERHGKTIQFRSNPGSVDVLCEADPSLLDQVFRNILENAIQAVPEPGEIDVRWSAVELNGEPALRISIQDDGLNFNAEQRARIFEAFYTTKTHGTGLGMTIAKRIVEAHQGLLEVGTGSAKGAEILITLPRGKI